ncbi:MAG: SLC13 family permease, partial [Thermodesulfobacteriota bacterium]
DITAIMVMVLLMLLKLVTPEEGISGFSNHAVITILAMFILSAGIEKTGLIHMLSVRIFGLVGSNEILQLLMVMVLVAPLSGFLNNAAIVAVLLPFVINLSRVSKTHPSKLLIPLSYVSMAAGMLTIIGTSTNLLTNSILSRYANSPETSHLGLSPFNMFDFWKIGMVVLITTMIYFLIIGYWLLPKKKEEKAMETLKGHKYIFEIKILEGSGLTGQMIKDSIFRKKYRMRILKMKRGNIKWKDNFSRRVLQEEDILTIEATRESLIDLESEPGIEILIEDLHKEADPEETIQMIVPQGSRFIGKKIGDLHLDIKYKAAVMAVSKGLKTITGPLENVRLSLADMLLLKTTSDHIEKLKKDRDLLIIDYLDTSYRRDKRLIAIVIVAFVVVVAALGLYPIVVTSLTGALLMILFGVVTSEEAYRAVRWEVIFLLAGLIPLGIALENTGATSLIADRISNIAVGFSVYWVLVGFYVFTTLITEIVSNNASVILLIPIGIDLAVLLGIDPYLLILVIMFAASTSFLTPVGYKTNTMVYGTGVYKFFDFFKVGILLNALLAIITPLVIMRIWTL